MAEQKPPIYLYTDGASSGNPGPGGYGIVMRCGSYEKEFSGGFILTTNNRMELLAVITGLEQIKWDKATVYVTSDSKYVVDAINKGWLQSWVVKGFKKKANKDLWMRLLPLLKKHDVQFFWIKGHNEHPENERCDRLAVNAGQGAFERGEALPHDEGYEAEQAAANADILM
ncbi:MAG: ribonuclease HI [Bacteroidales bacterium]|nr:ribonuclease HI [Bacteroidales bacterium]